MRSRSAAAALAIIASLVVAGCGGSGTGSLTAAELVTRASAICANASSEEKTLGIQDAQDMRQALPRLEQISTHEIGALAKLAPPSSEQGSYHELLRTASEITALLKPLSSALVAGEAPPPELLAHGRRLAARLAELGRSLGMAGCSSSSSTGV